MLALAVGVLQHLRFHHYQAPGCCLQWIQLLCYLLGRSTDMTGQHLDLRKHPAARNEWPRVVPT